MLFWCAQRALRQGLCVAVLGACLSLCSSDGTVMPPPPPPHLRGSLEQTDQPALRFAAAGRAVGAAPAIIEEVSERYLRPGVTNLAAGFSHWGPPASCMAEAQALLADNRPELHRYGACLGLPELIAMLKKKLEKENGIRGREVMVTAGANMAFVHAAMCLASPGDAAILFAPYYFSHRVALELLGVKPIYVECDDEMMPSATELAAALERAEASGVRVKMVAIVTPGNPSGAVISKLRLNELVKVCSDHKVWLVSDETYEYFTYDGAEHVSPHSADGVINIFSLSKSYGLAGWRVGYVAYPPSLHDVMLKAQDTLVTNCPIICQKIAIAALRAGKPWVIEQVKTLEASRKAIWEAIEPLNPVPVHGAFYYMVKIPSMLDEMQTIGLLAEKHHLLLTPGSAFGMPGYARIAFGAISPEESSEIGTRLMKGMSEMVRAGLRLSFDLQRSIPLASGRDGIWGQLDKEERLISYESRGVNRQLSTNGKELLIEEDE